MDGFTTGRVGTVFVDIEGDLSKLEAALSKAVPEAQVAGLKISNAFSGGFNAEGFTKSIAAIGGSMQQVGLIATGVGATIVGAFGAMAQAAAPFELEMRKVTSLLGAGTSESQFQKLSKDVLDLSTAMGTDAVQAADALYQAISAGVPQENAIDFLKVASQAAIAGVTDTKVAVDGLTTTIQAFGLNMSDAQKVADAMFQAVNIGKLTFPELSAAMGTAAGTAHALGIDFRELLAAAATLTLTTGQSVSQAMTMLESAMKAVLKPTKDMAALIRDTGFASGEALVKARGLEGALQAISNAAEGNITVLTKAFGRIEGLRGTLGLTGDNALKAADNLNTLKNSTGAATDAFNEIDKATSRTWIRLTNELKNAGIEIGMSLLPAVNDLLKASKPLVEDFAALVKWFATLPAGVQETAIAFVALGGPLTAAIGTLLKIPEAMRALSVSADAAVISTSTLTKVLKGAGYAAIAVSIYEIASAYMAMRDAQDLAERSEKDLTRTTQELEIRLRQHGVNTDEVVRKYSQGLITFEEYNRTLRSMAMAYANTTTAAGEHKEKVDQLKGSATSTTPAIDALRQATDNHATAQGKAAEAVGKHHEKVSSFKSLIGDMPALLSRFWSATDTYVEMQTKGIQAALDSAIKVNGVLTSLGTTAGGVAKQISDVPKAFDGLDQSIDKSTIRISGLEGVTDGFGNSIEDVSKSADKGQQVINGLDQVVNSLGQKVDVTSEALKRLYSAGEGTVTVLKGNATAAKDAGNAYSDMGVVIDGLTGKMESLAAVAKRARQTVGEATAPLLRQGEWPTGTGGEGAGGRADTSARNSTNTGIIGGGLRGQSVSAASYLSILAQMGAPSDVIHRAAEAFGLVVAGENSFMTPEEFAALGRNYTSTFMTLRDSMRATTDAARDASAGIDTLTAELEAAKTAAFGEDKRQAVEDFTDEADRLQEQVNRLAGRMYDLRMEGRDGEQEYRDLQTQLMQASAQLDNVNQRLATFGVSSTVAGVGLQYLQSSTNALSGAAKAASEVIIGSVASITAAVAPAGAAALPPTIMPNVGGPSGSPGGGAAGGSLVNVGNGRLQWVPPGGVTVVQNINGGTFSSTAFVNEVGKGLVEVLGRDVGAKL